MRIIYARVSTKDQDVEQQIEYLQKRYNADKVISDKLTGKDLERPNFILLKGKVKKGDSIIVQDLSRIGRNTVEVLNFIDEMTEKGVSLQVDDLGQIDITSAAGKMVLTTLAAVATMQREQMLEKQAIGIATAKANGKYKGKQQTQTTILKCQKALRYVDENDLSKEAAAKVVGISASTVYRFAREQKKQGLNA